MPPKLEIQIPQESKVAVNSTQESPRPSNEQNRTPVSSRPNSARRKSWLPANTRDPVVRDLWCGEVILELQALDEHLRSGFDTTYPPILSNYCKESVWTEFIKDINKAAKLKRKHKFVLSFRPMVSRVKIIRNAINAKLDKRTKPMLIMLNYWQDILKTYGLRAELRKGGQSIDKRLLTPPPTGLGRRNSELLLSGGSSISSSRSMYRNSTARESSSDLQEFGPVRPPFLQHPNTSRSSVLSRGSFAFGDVDTSLAGQWGLVLYSYRKRSELRSLYTRSRRHSSLSMTGSMKSGRPTTAMMLGDDTSSSAKSVRRQSRAKMLSLEELAKLPLPKPRSPFNAQDSAESKEKGIVVTAANTMSLQRPEDERKCSREDESSGNALSAALAEQTTTDADPALGSAHQERILVDEKNTSDKNSKDEVEQTSLELQDLAGSNNLENCPVMNASRQVTSESVGLHASDLPCIDSDSEIANADNTVIGAKAANSKRVLGDTTSHPNRMSRSPLSEMALTAKRMSADLEESADILHRKNIQTLNNRFSVSNFLTLASSVLTKSSKQDLRHSECVTPATAHESKATAATDTVLKGIRQELDCTNLKGPRSRASSFMTVVATPLKAEALESGSERPTLRVVSSSQLLEAADDIRVN